MAAEHCLKRYPQLSLTLDKRYTDPRLRDRLVETITDGVGPQAVLVFQQIESRQEQALQVADAVRARLTSHDRKPILDSFRLEPQAVITDWPSGNAGETQ